MTYQNQLLAGYDALKVPKKQDVQMTEVDETEVEHMNQEIDPNEAENDELVQAVVE